MNRGAFAMWMAAVSGCTDAGTVGIVGNCPARPEQCVDGVDNDCDGLVDEGACAFDAGASPIRPWGAYAATLQVPACPSAPELVVDTTTDELDGGETLSDPSQAGPRLSFVEALWIASNRLGPDTVRFDPKVFPVDAPAEILLGVGRTLPSSLSDVCIDGRNRGVEIRWKQESVDGCATCTLWLRENTLVVGLTLSDLPHEIEMRAGSHLAGCRLRLGTVARVCIVDVLHNADLGAPPQVGPGNVSTGPGAGVCISAGAVEVRGNDFGRDPRSGELLGQGVGVLIKDSVPAFPVRATIADNVFAVQGVGVQAQNAPGSVVVEGNFFGVDRALARLASETATGISTAGGIYRIGPDNVFFGLGTAVMVTERLSPSPPFAQLTRNRIWANAEAIVYRGVSAPPVPMLAAASTMGASGECPAEGTVEVFSDLGDQARDFLDSVDCTSGGSWSIDAVIESGLNVTATLTDVMGRTSPFSEPFPVP